MGSHSTRRIPAKLSQKFYERLGDEIANELVDWFNAVDTTYRSDVKELNDLNWTRFEAKLDQRMAQMDARMAQMDARMAQMETRLIRWMFAFWAPTALAVVALLLRG